MAEGGGSWWDSWYNAAKNKSVEVLEFVKRDLDEFSTAVKSEASSVVSNTTSALKDKLKLDEPESTANTVKRSVSSFLGQVTNALNPSPQDEDEEAIVIFNAQPVPLTNFQKKLYEIVRDPKTFLMDPEVEYLPQYEAWLEIIDDQLSMDRLSRQLSANPDLQRQYTKLVPDQVSHILFWHRYLFRKAVLEDAEAHKEAAKRRAEREKKSPEAFQWDHERDFTPNMDLTEEEQIRLLQEYEKECLEKTIKGEDSQFASELVGGDDKHYISSVKEVDPDTIAPKDSDIGVESNEELNYVTGLRMREKKDMVIVSEGNSCRNSFSSGDKEKDTDLTEEEQIRLLQEYQKECQEKTLKCKDNLLSESFEDNHYSSAVESRNGGVDPSLLKETESNKNLQNKNPIEISEEKDYLAVLKTREKKDMVIISEGNSCQTSSCSGDKESNDDDWEREFDLEDAECYSVVEQ